MGKVLLEEQNLIDIANSIRNKTNSTETMKPSEMATNIDNIESGGTDLSEYFTETISSGNSNNSGWTNTIKKIPVFSNSGTSCAYMFSKYQGNNVDLSNFNTSNVTSMSYMFNNCTELTNIIGLNNLDTSNVTDMQYMFSNLRKIEELNVKNFNTKNVKSMNYMFNSCYKLTTLDLSNFDTSNVTTMSNMFNNCIGLLSLNLSNFDMSNVTSTSYMFYSCRLLKHLDIRNFDFTNVTSYTYMFGNSVSNGIPASCLIIVKDETAKEWITSKFTYLTNVKTVAEYESGV